MRFLFMAFTAALTFGLLRLVVPDASPLVYAITVGLSSLFFHSTVGGLITVAVAYVVMMIMGKDGEIRSKQTTTTIKEQ